jgi:phosphoribosylformimino-5-aminoimidazole carboxamide ribotide isomerase
MLIIPAIDILKGKLVRLEKGDYKTNKVYSDNPFGVAQQFANQGFDLIHIVDLLGSKDGGIETIDLLKKIKSELKIKIQFGGGIRSLDDVKRLMDCDIDRIIIGSISITNKTEFEKIIQYVGAGKIITSIDTDNELIKVKGWAEQTGISIKDHISYCNSLNLKTFLCTDINKDGMMTGPNIMLYKKLMSQFPLANIIASGGVSSLKDLEDLRLQKLYAVVIGKAIYENKISLKELSKLARKTNHPLP